LAYGRNILIGHGEQVAIRVDRGAGVFAALPRPQIVGAAVKVEANEVATTMAFHIKLALTFVKDFRCRGLSNGIEAYAGTHLVEVVVAVAVNAVELAFSKHQISIGKTEQRIVGAADLR
jgi:hypothetical protein